MQNFNYNVNTYFDGEELTYRTNSIHNALTSFFDDVNEGYHTNIVNGFTGEVLAIANSPEGDDFATDEMALMMVGYLAHENWDEKPAEPTLTAEELVKALLDDLTTGLGH